MKEGHSLTERNTGFVPTSFVLEALKTRLPLAPIYPVNEVEGGSMEAEKYGSREGQFPRWRSAVRVRSEGSALEIRSESSQ